ncbi:uncharacterized protein KY384_005522 [Bacidia gigantensis]|uniref:uncharacterized protein n=1 Tax=Bacidia gigantensis TaxID=2732470 RepID=UPI001D0467B5|nr:uncharacterized protein KY384_005522 [Bacidia gigantensis]KAG8530040.1 hypothetical protein KY384_005522 [Bacidia gigantensis]
MSVQYDIPIAEQQKLDHDRLRGRRQKQKWAFGEREPTPGQQGRRPMKPLKSVLPELISFWPNLADDHNSVNACNAIRTEVDFRKNKDMKSEKISRNQVFRPDVDPDFAEHDEDIQGAFKGVAPDSALTYSYDNKRGANKGSQILGQAIARAVEKYETKATEKLIKEEYEIVGHEKDQGHSATSTDEDDFELL